MANSTSNLDLLVSGQLSPEITANALLDAASPATLFGRRASATAALTWGYYGGMMLISGVPTAINNGTVALTASATNYVEATAAGAVTANTSGWTAGRTRLYSVVTGTATVTSYTDHRAFLATQGTEVYDLSGFVPGVPTASMLMIRVPVARAIAFPVSLTGSYGKASVAATAQTDFDIQNNGVSVGTMRFAAAATSATFISAAGCNTVAGDVLSMVGPATPDATLANVGFVLTGTR